MTNLEESVPNENPVCLFCPKGHAVAYSRETVAQVPVPERDCDGRRMFSWGFYCSCCDKSYALNEYSEQPKTQSKQ